MSCLRSYKAEIMPHGQLSGGSQEESTLVRAHSQMSHLKLCSLCQPGHSQLMLSIRGQLAPGGGLQAFSFYVAFPG